MSCVYYVFAFVHCCLVVTCWERVDHLALVSDVYCNFVIFPFGIMLQVLYLIVSIPDPCCLSYLTEPALMNCRSLMKCSYTCI